MIRAVLEVLRALVAVGTHRPCGVEWSDGEAHLCDVDRRAAHAWHVCKCGVMYRRAW